MTRAARTARCGRRLSLRLLCDAPQRPRGELDWELQRLKRATAPRQQIELRFDRPLDRRWRIVDPLALARDPGRGGLVVESTRGLIAALPLSHDGGAVAITVELSAEHFEWGTTLALALGGDGDKPAVELALSGKGSTEQHEFVVSAFGQLEPIRAPAPPAGVIRFRHELYPELGLARVELELPGSAPVRRVQELSPGDLPPRLDLRIRAENVGLFYSARAVIHAITIDGLEIESVAETQRAEWSIVESDLLAALAALPDDEALQPGDERLLWRAHVLARLGELEAAAASLKRGVALEEASDERVEFEVRVVGRLQLEHSDRFAAAAELALGSAFVPARHLKRAYGHPRRPGEVRATLAELAEWPLTPSPDASPRALLEQVLALFTRGSAWLRLGRVELARRDLQAAAAIAEAHGVSELIGEIHTRQLTLATLHGDREEVLTALRVKLAESRAPEILLERYRNKPRLAERLSAEDWAALESLIR